MRRTALLICSTLVLGGGLAGTLGAVGGAAHADYATDCASPDRTLTGGQSSSFSVQPGETLRLTGGTFSGGIDSFPAGSTLCVASSATLTPAYLNNAAGALVVAAGGTVNLPSIAVATGFSLQNEGTVRASSLNVNGAATLHNAAGATLRIDGQFSPAAGTFTNDGTMLLEGGANLNGPVSVTNTRALRVTGTLTLNGVLENSGVASISGGFTVNGSGQLRNDCVLAVGGTLANNGPTSANDGVTGATGGFTNNGTWEQSTTGLLSAASLSNDGTVRGFGGYRFAGETRTQGSFTGSGASDPIVVDDRTPPAAPQIFDTQSGTVSNVVAGTVSPPELDGDGLPGCSGSIDPGTSADVEATKSAPELVMAGETITFTVTVTNHGPDPAAGVTLTDDLPANLLAPITASDGGTVSAGTVTWDLGTLTAGQTRTLTVTGTAPADGTLVNTVSATSTTDDADLTNNDGSAAQARTNTTVVPSIDPPGPPPDAPDYERTTTTWKPVFGEIPGGDPDLRYSVTTPPGHGTLTAEAGGALAYVPDNDFTGIDTFVYQVCDGGMPRQCASGTVTINVLPDARPDRAATPQDTPVRIAVLRNDTAGAPITTTSNGPDHGTVSIDASGVITYTPDAGYTGADSFDYTICSPTEPTFCDTTTARLAVTPVNHPPILAPLHLVTDVDLRVAGRLVGSDPDGDALTYRISGTARHGTATSTAGGAVLYRPTGGYAGHDLVPATVCDDGEPQLCDSALITLAVYPVAVDDRARAQPSRPVSIRVTRNDRGTHRAPVVVDRPGSGSVRVVGERIVYTPEDDFVGTDTFTYRLCTPGAAPLCRTATVTVVVSDDGAGGGSDDSGSVAGNGLAATGGPDRWLGIAGIGLVAAGAVVLLARRRRRSTAG